MSRSCLQKLAAFRSALSSCKYHHYKEERLVSPNNYYSKVIANEPKSVGSQESKNVVCPNTDDIRLLKEQLADATREQSSQRAALNQQITAQSSQLYELKRILERMSLQLTFNGCMMIAFYIWR